MHYTTIKDLPKAIKSLRNKGYKVLKCKMLLNNRTAYEVSKDDRSNIITDYHLLDVASYGGLMGVEK